ncbi:DinB family protein [Arthrobacter sp. NEB 688]|uniref:DinB family protein n=1 Tax=Arthrobacter sp. NEB 688 TaxID=904039 RepID=UPI0015639DDE|nr:DinB family protein [Arthrobacter sp. NEB 688]QKE85087.1 DinB family protein [Arthrobacter sp. NEB 688]
MASSTQGKDLSGTVHVDADLRGARFVECDLTRAVIRGCEISGLEIDAPWLRFGEPVTVNGIDITPYVEAELDKRFPGREHQAAESPDGLRTAWTSLEAAWTSAVERAGTMPPGIVDESVAGEWSFAQTLRHLVFATDKWLPGGALQSGRKAHALGLSHAAIDAGPPPPYDAVLAARADRQAQVRALLATATSELLDTECPNPNDPARTETVRQCVHVILEEEWEHLRFATRDLDVLAAARA